MTAPGGPRSTLHPSRRHKCPACGRDVNETGGAAAPVFRTHIDHLGVQCGMSGEPVPPPDASTMTAMTAALTVLGRHVRVDRVCRCGFQGPRADHARHQIAELEAVGLRIEWTGEQ